MNVFLGGGKYLNNTMLSCYGFQYYDTVKRSNLNRETYEPQIEWSVSCRWFNFINCDSPEQEDHLFCHVQGENRTSLTLKYWEDFPSAGAALMRTVSNSTMKQWKFLPWKNNPEKMEPTSFSPYKWLKPSAVDAVTSPLWGIKLIRHPNGNASIFYYFQNETVLKRISKFGNVQICNALLCVLFQRHLRALKERKAFQWWTEVSPLYSGSVQTSF